MASILIILAITLIALLVYALAVEFRKHRFSKLTLGKLPPDYYMGLNYLIDEKPDNAIDVFVKLLQVDSGTVETHLSLGNLFRRQGEVERAIRIHQNLIARPELSKEHRTLALFALAQDYLHAGLLDRAERIFLELIQQKQLVLESSKALMRIYQQEKDWKNAIEFAKKIQSLPDRDMKTAIAHFYCELAEQAVSEGHIASAENYLREAKNLDPNCARIAIVKAQLAKEAKDYRTAIKFYQEVVTLDELLFLEFLQSMAECYQALNAEQELENYLENLLTKKPSAQILAALTLAKLRGKSLKNALEWMGQYLEQFPSLISLATYLDLLERSTQTEYRDQLEKCRRLIQKILAEKAQYQCIECGYSGKVFDWSCPSCYQWGTIKPILHIH